MSLHHKSFKMLFSVLAKTKNLWGVGKPKKVLNGKLVETSMAASVFLRKQLQIWLISTLCDEEEITDVSDVSPSLV